MEKKAIISIISNAAVQEGDDNIEVVSPGKFIKIDDGYKVIYEESEISGMKGTTTYLTIKGEELILERKGTTATKMIFNEKEPSVCMYQTPYGLLQVNIHTRKLSVDMKEDGGIANIDYLMSVAGEISSETNLNIKVLIQN